MTHRSPSTAVRGWIHAPGFGLALILAVLAAALALVAGALVKLELGGSLPAGMSLGAVTLAQAVLASPDELTAGVVETFILESSVLDRAPFMGIEGGAFPYNKEATLPGIEFRAINAAYAESTGTIVQAVETLVILGGDADVDRFLMATRRRTNLKADQTTMKVKAAAYKFQSTFINGDVAVDTNSFDGLKKRLTGGQVILAATNGLPVVGADSNARHTFLDKLDEAIAAVPGLNADNGVIYCNDLVKAKIMSSARRESIATTSVDEFGKTTDRYRGIRVVDIGSDAAGTRIIPQTETAGASSITSSAYIVKFGANEAAAGVTVIFNGPESIFDVRDLGELQAKPSDRIRIEGYCGLATFGGKAASRLSGILAS
jgi:hypothetical protein